jgi:hypothetical protein
LLTAIKVSFDFYILNAKSPRCEVTMNLVKTLIFSSAAVLFCGASAALGAGTTRTQNLPLTSPELKNIPSSFSNPCISNDTLKTGGLVDATDQVSGTTGNLTANTTQVTATSLTKGYQYVGTSTLTETGTIPSTRSYPVTMIFKGPQGQKDITIPLKMEVQYTPQGATLTSLSPSGFPACGSGATTATPALPSMPTSLPSIPGLSLPKF